MNPRKVAIVIAHCILASWLAAQTTAVHHSTKGVSSQTVENRLPLHEGWSLQTSAKVEAKGETISTPGFSASGWLQVTVPTTVVAAQVKDKLLPDPFFAMNLRDFPGMNYPIGGNFSNIAMATDSPYAVSWWYRKSFAIPASYKGKTMWLKFDGINYRANIWLNGKQIATDNDVAGAWRTYEFNITGSAKPGAQNVLAVQVWAPTENDLAITFVDWNPAPPDKNMGLWRDVYLTTSGPIDRHGTGEERNESAGQGQAERNDSVHDIGRDLRTGCRTGAERIQRCNIHARQIPTVSVRESPPVVAGADGYAESLQAHDAV